MDKDADLRKFRDSILTFEECPTSPVAREDFNHWRHHCFMNYPVGEVLKVQGETYAEIGKRTRATSKFPRRWLEVT